MSDDSPKPPKKKCSCQKKYGGGQQGVLPKAIHFPLLFIFLSPSGPPLSQGGTGAGIGKTL
jgi:hypothetical protein